MAGFIPVPEFVHDVGCVKAPEFDSNPLLATFQKLEFIVVVKEETVK
jgi:hypothetical protein